VETIKETSGCLTVMGQQSAPIQCWQAGRGGGGSDDNNNTICILIFSATISETFLILRRIQQNTAINTQMYSCKVPIIYVIF